MKKKICNSIRNLDKN